MLFIKKKAKDAEIIAAKAAEEAKAVLVVVGRPFEVGKILKETKKFLEIWAGLC